VVGDAGHVEEHTHGDELKITPKKTQFDNPILAMERLKKARSNSGPQKHVVTEKNCTGHEPKELT